MKISNGYSGRGFFLSLLCAIESFLSALGKIVLNGNNSCINKFGIRFSIRNFHFLGYTDEKLLPVFFIIISLRLRSQPVHSATYSKASFRKLSNKMCQRCNYFRTDHRYFDLAKSFTYH